MAGIDWDKLSQGFASGFQIGTTMEQQRRARERDAMLAEQNKYLMSRRQVVDQREDAEYQRTQQFRQGVMGIEESRVAGKYDVPGQTVQVPNASKETFNPAQMGQAAVQPQQGVNVDPAAGTTALPHKREVTTGKKVDTARYYEDMASMYRRYGDPKTANDFQNLAQQEPHRVFLEQVQNMDRAIKLNDPVAAAKSMEDVFNRGFPDGRVATVDYRDGKFHARFFRTSDGGPVGEQVMTAEEARTMAMSLADPKAYNDALAASVKHQRDLDLKIFDMVADIAKKDDQWEAIKVKTGEHSEALIGYIDKRTGRTVYDPRIQEQTGFLSFKDHTKDIAAYYEKTGKEVTHQTTALINKLKNFNPNLDIATSALAAEAALAAGDKGVHTVSGKGYIVFNGRVFALDPVSPQELDAATNAIRNATPAPGGKTPGKAPAATPDGKPAAPGGAAAPPAPRYLNPREHVTTGTPVPPPVAPRGAVDFGGQPAAPPTRYQNPRETPIPQEPAAPPVNYQNPRQSANPRPNPASNFSGQQGPRAPTPEEQQRITSLKSVATDMRRPEGERMNAFREMVSLVRGLGVPDADIERMIRRPLRSIGFSDGGLVGKMDRGEPRQPNARLKPDHSRAFTPDPYKRMDKPLPPSKSIVPDNRMPIKMADGGPVGGRGSQMPTGPKKAVKGAKTGTGKPVMQRDFGPKAKAGKGVQLAEIYDVGMLAQPGVAQTQGAEFPDIRAQAEQDMLALMTDPIEVVGRRGPDPYAGAQPWQRVGTHGGVMPGPWQGQLDAELGAMNSGVDLGPGLQDRFSRLRR